ncbi:MAG: hypothetical protein ABI151_09110 [Chitinophagaceae bacterium]
MRYVFSVLLFLLIFFSWNYATEAISYGTIELSVTSSANAGAEQGATTAVFLYYNNYLVEKFQSSRLSKNGSGYVDSVFCFIDPQKKYCTEYDEMSKTAKEITSYPLENKTYGYLFPHDSVTRPENYLRAVNMPDTAIDFYTYKRFYIITKTRDSVTYYISPSKLPIPFHLNRVVDADYKGTLIRIDALKLGSKLPDVTSLRMQVYPNRMYSNELGVLGTWIARATGKK